MSREAFAALTGKGDEEARIRRAIEVMSQKAVKGVGPATASAVLAAYRYVAGRGWVGVVRFVMDL